jgi:5-dehydro-4-deoxyglucarate dehydratase
MTSYKQIAMDPAALKSAISDGLLSFPLTDFTPDLAFDAEGYRNASNG